MKSRILAIVLTFFLGGIGVGDFYLGRYVCGFIKLALCVLGVFTLSLTWFPLGLWVLFDFVKLILTSDASFNQKYNK